MENQLKKIFLTLIIDVIFISSLQAQEYYFETAPAEKYCRTDVFLFDNKYLWSSSDLCTTTFNNGDTIMYCRNIQEWNFAAENKIAACCSYEFADSLKEKVLFYNYWSYVQRAKLAPQSWHVATHDEWQKLSEKSINPYISYYTFKHHTKAAFIKNVAPYNFCGFDMFYNVDTRMIEFEYGDFMTYWQNDENNNRRSVTGIGAVPSRPDSIEFLKYQGALIRCVKDY